MIKWQACYSLDHCGIYDRQLTLKCSCKEKTKFCEIFYYPDNNGSYFVGRWSIATNILMLVFRCVNNKSAHYCFLRTGILHEICCCMTKNYFSSHVLSIHSYSTSFLLKISAQLVQYFLSYPAIWLTKVSINIQMPGKFIIFSWDSMS